jgi:hypothetical protein
MTIDKLKQKWHLFPMEDVNDHGEVNLKRKLVVIPHDEGRNEMVERLSTAADAGKIDSYVWATPVLPMLIFITAGRINFCFIFWRCSLAISTLHSSLKNKVLR